VGCERTRDSRLLLWQSTILANSTMRSGSIVIQCAQRRRRIHQKKGHVGKHRSTAVCAVDDGRFVADRAAGAAHRAGGPLVDHAGPGLRLRPLCAGNGHPDAAHPEQRDPPNIAALLTVEFGLRLTQSIGTFAGLDYLGLSTRPAGADRGLMIQESQRPGQRTVSVLLPIIAIAVLAASPTESRRLRPASSAQSRYETDHRPARRHSCSPGWRAATGAGLVECDQLGVKQPPCPR
jgi:hypothetical protein